MVKLNSLVFALIGVSILSACSTFDRRKGDSRLGEDRRGDTVAGFVGLPASLEIDFNEAAPAVESPYGGAGAAANCETLSADLARLTAALGPDYDRRAAEAEAAEVPAGSDRDWVEIERDGGEIGSRLE